MSEKDRVEFFDNLKYHSKAKIDLLNTYLVPWIRKVTLGTKQKCLICDTFAGEGIYADGTKGSPFVIIDKAIEYLEQEKIVKYEVLLAFVEADKNKFKALKLNLEKRFNIEFFSNRFNPISDLKLKILITNDEHSNFLNNLREQISSLVPSLFFVDPFGFKGIKLSDITSTINKYRSCEFIVNFMYEEFNRFKSVLRDKESIIDFFGSDINEIIENTNNLNSKERRNVIIAKYKENINKFGVKYVLDFDIHKDNSLATKMVLIFMSNSAYGFNVMKSAMLKLAQNIDFEYYTKIKKAYNNSLFDEVLFIDEMICELKKEFSGKTVRPKDVVNYCTEHPFIPDEKAKELLRKMSANNELYITKNGKEKRNPQRFPDDCLIVFN